MKCNKNCGSTKDILKKHQFDVYENTIKRDINNDNVNTSNKIGTIWGVVKNKSPYYAEFNNSTYNKEVTHIITTSYISQLDTKKWLKLNNKIFDIIKIINVGESNKELQLYCIIREQL